MRVELVVEAIGGKVIKESKVRDNCDKQLKQHLKEKNMLCGAEPLEANPSLMTVNFKLLMFPATAPITDARGNKWGTNIFLYIEHEAGLES